MVNTRPIGNPGVGETHSFRVNQDADFLKFMRDEGGVDFFKNDLRKEKDRMKVAEFLGLKDKWNHLKEKHAKEKTSNRKVLFDFFGMPSKMKQHMKGGCTTQLS